MRTSVVECVEANLIGPSPQSVKYDDLGAVWLTPGVVACSYVSVAEDRHRVRETGK